MNKLMRVLIVSSPMYLLSGCGVDVVTYDTVAYDPGYNNNYVYSVGYYNTQPYWGNNYYYSGYGLRTPGYWGSYYY